MWDENYVKKPSYAAMLKAIQETRLVLSRIRSTVKLHHVSSHAPRSKFANHICVYSNPRACNADNCLRALRANTISGRLEESQSFCASFYTQYIVTDLTMVKPYAASACVGDVISRVSSGCSCLPTATST